MTVRRIAIISRFSTSRNDFREEQKATYSSGTYEQEFSIQCRKDSFSLKTPLEADAEIGRDAFFFFAML